ncbi:MAG: hypothetical protein E3J76_06580 [Candidatus Aminicenantes bacterium]|nr:MAG: hypothetical protein E3J76_06580 [Candidatus Aminicenantes bacterium]
MKKWILIAILILIIILLSCQKQNIEEPAVLEKAKEREESYPIAEKIRTNLLTALDQLEKGNIDKGTELLLDAVLLTSPSENMPEGFENKIFASTDQFQQKNYTEAVELVTEALLIFKAGADLPGEKDKEERTDIGQAQKKEELSQIAPLAELMRSKILSAMDEFKIGNADKGVILILESLQLFAPKTD